MKSLRSCISKNSLILSKEIFELTNKNRQLDNLYYELLIPIMLTQTAYDKNFIKKIALDALTILETKQNF